MSHSNDIRLIDDYLPIEAISAEASREKSVRKGHISTLHLWWARRPLVACRAAVYGALVPADRWVKEIELKDPPADAAKAEKVKNGKKKGLNRKAAREFVTRLCRYPKTNPTKEEDIRIKRETEAAIVEAQRHILEAHAERLTAELAEALKLPLPPGEGWGEGAPGWLNEFQWPREKTVVSYEDIVAGRAPRPRVLDMFAGGGAIPLEALRLGCEAYALDLNPVAHIIQLCTLVYPQKYGKPDPNARGMTGPKNAQGETTWGGLAEEVRYWGHWVLDRVRQEIGDLYPPIPDPEVWSTPPEIAFDQETGAWKVIREGKLKRGVRLDVPAVPRSLLPDNGDDAADDEEAGGSAGSGVPALPPGFLQPVAYLWTRTVRCKNPGCGATVPLVRQTWLRKKKRGPFIALRTAVSKGDMRVKFKLAHADEIDELGFDPSAFSSRGNAVCALCGTVSDLEYTKREGWEGRIGRQLLAIVAQRPYTRGKRYLAVDEHPGCGADEAELAKRLSKTVSQTGISVPDEPIAGLPLSSDRNTLGITVRPYGIRTFGDVFMTRQLITDITFCQAIRDLHEELRTVIGNDGRVDAVTTSLALVVDKMADYSNTASRWGNDDEGVTNAYSRQVLTMVWDFAEAAPWSGITGSWQWGVDFVASYYEREGAIAAPVTVTRSSALAPPFADESLDAVVTDPPYYDNVPYADIADLFYVWLKRSVGSLHPEHLSGQLTPKKSEAIADADRHGGNWDAAKSAYERMMGDAFRQSYRMLKPGGAMTVVYAHKTTLGWATLVEALRSAGFAVGEAWPLDTESKGRLRGHNSAALASSIFLVARKRSGKAGTGNYEDDVQPELQQIVRERVETLWEMGIAGADLVIACVGAGLRAFTKYQRVEYANGEEVPAEKFLAEVEGVVLDTMMEKLMASSRPLTLGASPARGRGEKVVVSAIDPASRFYILWRFVYKASEIDAGEAIVFTYGQHVELDGPLGLSTGKDALVEKKKANYRVRDFTERGDNDKLGLPGEDGRPAPLIDVLHRVLWLMENSPRKLREFLAEASPDRERLRILAQALAGAALSGKSEEDAERLVGTTPAERAALGKLLANWRSVVEDAVVSEGERSDRKRGQQRLDLK